MTKQDLYDNIAALIETGHNNVSWYELNRDVQELLNEYFDQQERE